MNPLTPPPNCSRGYCARNYDAMPLGSAPNSVPFNYALIPEDEWVDRIDHLNKNRLDLLSLCQDAGVKWTFQNGLPYCWMHGTTHAYYAVRAKQGLPFVELSATAGAATIKRFRQVGGNTWDAIPHLSEKGLPTVEKWPENSMRREHDNPETWAEAAKYRVDELIELEPNNFAQKMTLLLLGIPVVTGYAHWGHMVCDLRPLYRRQGRSVEYGVRGPNSWAKNWGPYGDGTFELWDRKAVSFDQAGMATSREYLEV